MSNKNQNQPSNAQGSQGNEAADNQVAAEKAAKEQAAAADKAAKEQAAAADKAAKEQAAAAEKLEADRKQIEEQRRELEVARQAIEKEKAELARQSQQREAAEQAAKENAAKEAEAASKQGGEQDAAKLADLQAQVAQLQQAMLAQGTPVPQEPKLRPYSEDHPSCSSATLAKLRKFDVTFTGPEASRCLQPVKGVEAFAGSEAVARVYAAVGVKEPHRHQSEAVYVGDTFAVVLTDGTTINVRANDSETAKLLTEGIQGTGSVKKVQKAS